MARLRAWKHLLSFLLIASLLASVGVIKAEEEVRVMVDGFAYEDRLYPGNIGPGKIWYQYPAGAEEVDFETVVWYAIAYWTEEGYLYYIHFDKEALGTPEYGYGAKSVYGFREGHLCRGGKYIGPNDYEFKARVFIARGGGSAGLIFRVQRVEDKPLIYHLFAVNAIERNAYLYLIDESSWPIGVVIHYRTRVPEDVNLEDWFYLSVRVQGNNIKAFINEHKVVDLTREEFLDSGWPGLWSGTRAWFDAVWLTAIIPEAETVTTTITEETIVTEEVTVTETTTMTETVEVGVEATVTETETVEVETTVTETVTEAAEVQTTTVTESITETITKTETATAPAETITETVTETATVIEQPRCLIATAAFGSEIAPQVQVLREFRDGFVMKTFAGRNFMKAFNAFYYSWSPYIAQAEYENQLLRGIIKASIYPLLSILELSRNAAEPFSWNPELAVLISGLVASSLIGLVYLASPILALKLFMGMRGKRMNPSLRYPIMALILGLTSFMVAELTASPILMMISSSIIVLSSMTLTAIGPARLIRKGK